MKCPSCENLMTQNDMDGIVLDVCTEFCGGIWFDAGEFQRYDEAHETAPMDILRPIRNANVAVDRNKARPCPRCEDTTLQKRFVDDAHELQIDQCVKCSGIFLDPGELETLRDENRGEVERKRVIEDFYSRATPSDEKSNKGLKAVLKLLFK